jgi:hypothetical protein
VEDGEYLYSVYLFKGTGKVSGIGNEMVMVRAIFVERCTFVSLIHKAVVECLEK